jgi:hypothetical protein
MVENQRASYSQVMRNVESERRCKLIAHYMYGMPWCAPQSTYRGSVEIEGVYLPSQLERTILLCT